MPVLFLHIGWAREYQGSPDDPPQGKFGYIVKGIGPGHEDRNFMDVEGHCFGYAPSATINLNRLVPQPNADDFLDNVDVVWTATNPDGTGRYIVGWYRNARIFSERQKRRGRRRWYIAEAPTEQCRVLSLDERTFFIPRGKGWPGTASAFYASDTLSEAQLRLIENYLDGATSTGFFEQAAEAPRGGRGTQQTPEETREVELAAEGHVIDHYRAEGWTDERVATENLGWDLEFTLGARKLLVEVKGRSADGAVEVTPNEYLAMNGPATRMLYRLAIVHYARTDEPRVRIFEYVPGTESWETEAGDSLTVKLLTGARLSIARR